jgi:hypothetical protein
MNTNKKAAARHAAAAVERGADSAVHAVEVERRGLIGNVIVL